MTKRQLLVQQAISTTLVVAAIVMLGWLSTRYKAQVDWTAGNSSTLTEASQKQLAALPDPLKFLVFAYPTSEVRATVDANLQPYRRFKPDIAVEYVDPRTNPQKIKEYNVSHAGEVVIEYQGRRESVSSTTEQAITTALQRLAYGGERWIVFLEGHGEHDINDTEQNGYAEFAQVLKDKGLHVKSLNLATDPRIPDNTAVLVVAAPTRPLLAGEAKLVTEYVDRGGNLLWLVDPVDGKVDPAASLEPLAKMLQVSWLKGTGILLESAQLGLPPFVYITTQYPANPVTQGFGENAVFPLVRGLSYKSPAGTAPDPTSWNAQPLLTTSENAWLETGALEGDLGLEEARGDTKGPLTLGVTLTRELRPATPATPPQDGAPPPAPKAPAQRVALIGDSDFLSNAYFAQLGNSLLGLNLAQWLASRDEQLNIDVPTAPDRDFDVSKVGGIWGLYAIYIFFFLLLPAGLVGFGVTRWVVRRRK
jgi:ABC-type uncharacterized transport system involved in gliding motility auxiliary subunit